MLAKAGRPPVGETADGGADPALRFRAETSVESESLASEAAVSAVPDGVPNEAEFGSRDLEAMSP